MILTPPPVDPELVARLGELKAKTPKEQRDASVKDYLATSASTRGVLCMLAWGIARPYGGRDAALRVLGIALLSTSLGENKYSRGLSGKERRIESGYAGANNDKIVVRL